MLHATICKSPNARVLMARVALAAPNIAMQAAALRAAGSDRETVVFRVGIIGGADGEVVASGHHHVVGAGDLRGSWPAATVT
jgi:hypothetical protein